MIDGYGRTAYRGGREVRPVDQAGRRRVLAESGLVHPNPAAVRAPLFESGTGFFLAADKVQVKYEMLRVHLVDGWPVTEAAAAHGYSRAAFYLVSASFEQLGMAGLLDERRGRRGPVKLRAEIVEFIRAQTQGSGAEVAELVAERFGVRLHRRTVERARGR
jgi:transposase